MPIDTCEKCNKEIPDAEIDEHTFCGYEYYIAFCSKCCPQTFDGMRCDGETGSSKRPNANHSEGAKR